MSLFNLDTPIIRCGAIIDIGSGSVGVAIVVSNTVTGNLTIVWSHRIHMLIKEHQNKEELEKEINTTLVSALLELGSSGVKALYSFDPKLSITHIQSAVCAPWSYTVTKTIHYEDDKKFEVTEQLIDQLVETAKKQVLASTLDGALIKDLGLETITDTVIDIQLNGYSIKEPIGHKSKDIILSHLSALAQEKIIQTAKESVDKILPKVKISHYSFMYMYYQVLRHLHPDTSEICLIDITNEATEIGIVRDDVLRHTTHIPFGMYSLAREITLATGIPKEEAYALMKDEEGVMLSTYSEKNKDKIGKILTAYENEVTELFKNTGDVLAIPKTLFMHVSKNTETFFAAHIKNATQKATGLDHTVHLFTSELLGDKTMSDTALALSAHYFHTQDAYKTYQ